MRLAQNPPQDLSRRILWEPINKPDLVRNLISSHMLRAERNYIIWRNNLPIINDNARQNTLTFQLVRNATNSHFCDRGMLRNYPLQFTRRNLKSRNINHVFQAINNVEIALFIHPAQISSMKPTI